MREFVAAMSVMEGPQLQQPVSTVVLLDRWKAPISPHVVEVEHVSEVHPREVPSHLVAVREEQLDRQTITGRGRDVAGEPDQAIGVDECHSGQVDGGHVKAGVRSEGVVKARQIQRAPAADRHAREYRPPAHAVGDPLLAVRVARSALDRALITLPAATAPASTGRSPPRGAS
jgi:hypothetical protein